MNEKGLQRRIKHHVLAKTHRFLAITAPGFEGVTAGELAELGIGDARTVSPGGVEFSGRLNDCYRANLSSRTAARIVMRLFKFRALHFRGLRESVRSFPWELFIANESGLRLKVSASKSKLYHTGRIAEEFRAGIGERFAGIGSAEDAVPHDGDGGPMILVRFHRDTCGVSLDSSGALLYRRGYRTASGAAPLRENLAASILLEAGLRRYDMLIDPMCGSGTFGTEAAMIMAGIMPGSARSFAFQEWPGYRPAAFGFLKKKLESGETGSRPFDILCGDRDAFAVEGARENFTRLGDIGPVTAAVERRDFLREPFAVPEGRRALFVLNPPYGARIEAGNVKALYGRIGERIRASCGNGGVAILVPGLECEKALSLPYDRKILFRHGGIGLSLLVRDGRQS